MLIIILCVLFALWSLWSWLKPRHPMSPPTYPGAWPIIGHAHRLIVNAQDLWSLEKMVNNYCLQNEDIVEIRLGPHSMFILTDPEDCLTVANKCLDKPYVCDFGNEMYENGLVNAKASVWKSHRRLLNSSFNQHVLHTYLEEFIIQAKSLVAELSSEEGKEPFDVQPYLISNMMTTACRTIVGIKSDEIRVIAKNYAHALDELLITYIERIKRVWLHLSFIYNWSSYKKKEKNLMKIMNDITEAAISNRKSELRLISSSDKTKETASVILKKRLWDQIAEIKETNENKAKEQFKPLLDHVLDLADKQDAFSDAEIREHIDTFLAGAYDTTATTLTFTLILIGTHQDVQERIYKELLEVFGNQKRDLNRHDLPKLVYMEAVIKEALRLYPIVTRLGRCSTTAVQLKKYILPANCTYAISVYGLNRHPTWGPDADQFRPERWLDPATLPKIPSTFASFGVGRRNCIGKLYGMMSVKTNLTYILRAYRIKSDVKKLVMGCDVVLKPVTGHEICLESRT